MEEILASIRRIISDDGDDAPLPTKDATSISTAAIDALFGARVAPEETDPIPSFLRQEPSAVKPAEAARKVEPRASQAEFRREPEPRVQSEPRPQAEPRAQAEMRPRVEQPRAEQPRTDLSRTEPLLRPSLAPREASAAAPTERRAPDPVQPAAAPPVIAEVSGRQLLSPAADAAVTASFGDLATTLLSGQARTLEDLVKDMLRPMLKAWLDTNLPPLVERLVRDEIERVSRGR